METIKIIDLLKNYADGKEKPKKIKYSNIEWEYNIHLKDYQGYDNLHDTTRYFSNWVCFTSLNDEVKILDEEDGFEDIEEFKEHKLINTKDILELEMIINKINADYNYKINQLIKNQKKIIERLKDE